MKSVYKTILVILVASTILFGYQANSSSQQQNNSRLNANAENTFLQSGDPCSGTGGIGQILSKRNNSLTITRNDGSQNQFINLSDQVTVRISTGAGTVSDLKTGDSVTLAGSPNPDGSFTANIVAICDSTGHGFPPPLRMGNMSTNHKISVALGLSAIIIVSLVWIGITLFLRSKKKKDLVYLLFFTIFYLYLVVVLDLTLYRYQYLLLLKHFTPGLILHGLAASKRLNLIPLITLTPKDVKTSLLNILLFVPFGFLLPFITKFRMRIVVVTGALFSIAIELTQLVTGLLAKLTFRVADINDVIFDTAGAAVGYILFIGLMRMYRHTSYNRKMLANEVLRYIAERPQINK